jgi:hypothetical protein
LKIGQQFEQEGLEFLVGAVDLVDQQDGLFGLPDRSRDDAADMPRDFARSTARRSIRPAILVRYSAGPRGSEAGLVRASAAATARSRAGLSKGEPTRASVASRAHSGVSATLVRPIEQLAQTAPSIVSTTAAAAVA